jgi:hypothetical protein
MTNTLQSTSAKLTAARHALRVACSVAPDVHAPAWQTTSTLLSLCWSFPKQTNMRWSTSSTVAPSCPILQLSFCVSVDDATQAPGLHQHLVLTPHCDQTVMDVQLLVTGAALLLLLI